jgi:anti-sigma regulatory factor (Ser/Thr protein kinase)
MTAPDAPLRSVIRTAEGLRLRLAASAGGLAEAQPVLRTFLDQSAVPAAVADRAELLVEEVVMNVHMHGFEDPAEAEVELHAVAGPEGCTLVFEDAGRAFDPTAGELADRAASLDEATPGGLGLVLLRRMASRLDYLRLPSGRNQVTVVLAARADGPAPAA